MPQPNEAHEFLQRFLSELSAPKDKLGAMLHNPSEDMVQEDIKLNEMLGGNHETISARIGRDAKQGNPIAEEMAKTLDWLDAGHTERALHRSEEDEFHRRLMHETGTLDHLTDPEFYRLSHITKK